MRETYLKQRERRTFPETEAFLYVQFYTEADTTKKKAAGKIEFCQIAVLYNFYACMN